jgi:uncharacterized membrane protein YdbT with pleckstrin-like domain
MAFPKRLLIEGEELVLDLRPHPVALALPAFVLLVSLIGAVWLTTATTINGWIWWGIFIAIVIAYVIPKFLNWWTSVFAVTSDRLVHRSGWISKTSMEIPLEAINDVRLEQGVIDRMVGAGSILISSASTGGTNRFEDVRHPEEVQKTIYEQGEMNKKRMYQGDQSVTNTPATPTVAPSTMGELERLGKLRADGVLTEAEFQEQKRRILGDG